MKIVIIRPGTSNFGKIGTYNVQEVGLANALIKKGHDVTVLYLNRPTDTVIQDETYRYVYYLPHKTIGLHGIFNVNLLENYKPEKVIIFSDGQLWSKNIIDWCSKRGIPVIHYFGNVVSDNPKWTHQFYTKLILLRNRSSYKKSINVAKTRRVEGEMKKYNINCRKVINVGLDDSILQPNRNLDEKLRTELGYDKNQIILLFVGRLVSYKKPIMACQIVKEMLNRGQDVKLIVIGKGKLEQELENAIHELRIEKNVDYIGRVPYNEMYKYFVASDCIINLSAQEIFGMTILEAMYYQLPVVAHTAPGPNDIIDNGKDGFLCDTDDINSWVDLINEAIKNRKDIGVASIRKIEKHYLWDSIADDFLRL